MNREKNTLRRIGLTTVVTFLLATLPVATVSPKEDEIIEGVTSVLKSRIEVNLRVLFERTLANNQLLEKYAPNIAFAAKSEDLLWLLSEPDLFETVIAADLVHIQNEAFEWFLESLFREILVINAVNVDNVKDPPWFTETLWLLFEDLHAEFSDNATDPTWNFNDSDIESFVDSVFDLVEGGRLSNSADNLSAPVSSGLYTLLILGSVTSETFGSGESSFPMAIDAMVETHRSSPIDAIEHLTDFYEHVFDPIVQSVGPFREDLALVRSIVEPTGDATHKAGEGTGANRQAILDRIDSVDGYLDKIEKRVTNRLDDISSLVADTEKLLRAFDLDRLGETVETISTHQPIESDDLINLAYVSVSLIELVEYVGSENLDDRDFRALDDATRVILVAVQIVEIAKAHDATTAEEVAGIIESYLLPPVSYESKRRSGVHAFVSAYAGVALTPLAFRDYTADTSDDWFMPSVPLGIELSVAGTRYYKRNETRARRSLWPISFFVSPVDFLGPLVAQVQDNDRDWRFEDVLLPSAHLTVAVPDLPLSVGVAWRGILGGDDVTHHLGVVASVDVPLLQLF